MRRRRWPVNPVLLTMILGALILGACTAGVDSTPGMTTSPPGEESPSLPVQPGDDRELILAYTADIKSLDPAGSLDVPNWVAALQIYNSLVRYDWHAATIDIQPDLAERWEISEDASEYTFYLREGVQFHKGYGEFTADDVVFHFERAMDPDTGSPAAVELSVIDTVEALDTYTVRFTLKEPSTDFIESVVAHKVGLIPSKAAVEEFGEEFWRENPIGTGPYVLDEWIEGQELRLVANEDYFRGAPSVKRAKLVVIPDASVAALAIQRGEIHGMWVRQPETYAQLQDVPGVRLVDQPGAHPRGLYFNLTRAPLDDLRVRQALAYAIDREALSGALNGLGAPGASVIPPGVFGHTDDVTQYPQDLDRARQLLADAGYDGGGFSLDVITRSTDATMGEALFGFWSEIGVTVNLEVVEPAVFAERRTGDYDVLLQGLARATVGPYITQFTSDAEYLHAETGYSNARVDEIIQIQGAETDRDARTELLAEFQRIIADEVPALPLLYMRNVTAYHESVTGDVTNNFWWFFILEEMSFTD